MATKNQKEAQLLASTLLVVGQALGEVLPIIAKHPPASPDEIGVTLSHLDDLFVKLTKSSRAQNSDILRAHFVEAIMQGLNATRLR